MFLGETIKEMALEELGELDREAVRDCLLRRAKAFGS